MEAARKHGLGKHLEHFLFELVGSAPGLQPASFNVIYLRPRRLRRRAVTNLLFSSSAELGRRGFCQRPRRGGSLQCLATCVQCAFPRGCGELGRAFRSARAAVSASQYRLESAGSPCCEPAVAAAPRHRRRGGKSHRQLLGRVDARRRACTWQAALLPSRGGVAMLQHH